VGAYATIDRGTLRIKGFVGSPDGAQRFEAVKMGPDADPEALGRALAQELLEAGGAEVLKALRVEA
jgi:hydroxymethylbilane synthase